MKHFDKEKCCAILSVSGALMGVLFEVEHPVSHREWLASEFGEGKVISVSRLCPQKCADMTEDADRRGKAVGVLIECQRGYHRTVTAWIGSKPLRPEVGEIWTVEASPPEMQCDLMLGQRVAGRR